MAEIPVGVSVDTVDDKPKGNLTMAANLKLAIFHLGSGMADVLTTGVWNRIMVTDLKFAATPIALLVALRYFLAPLGVWAGRMSDTQTLFGFRRMFWIGLGRGLMVASTFILGFTTVDIAREGLDGQAYPLQWALLILSFLMFSFGTAISGTTFLALVYDRSPEHQRGRAVGIVWTFLLLGYTFAGILFGALLPSNGESNRLLYSIDALQTLFIVAAVLCAVIWFISMFGEETRQSSAAAVAAHVQDKEKPRSLKQDLRLVWVSRSMRFFMFYLALSMFFAFSQDLILEPFAGDVFAMPASVTNRFSAYWGTTAIVGTLFFIWYSRKDKRLTNQVMSQIGMGFLALTFGLLAFSSFMEIRQLVTPSLILLGVGLGIWNVGTLGLMMDMSPLGRAGTFLGFWTLVVTFSRGFGTAFGGIARDVFLFLTDSKALTYGLAFSVGLVGLLIGMACLTQINMAQYKRDEQADTAAVLAGAMD
ncbi:BCD family MFS transporter [Aggregatilineales bacterium SYSU G02658]